MPASSSSSTLLELLVDWQAGRDRGAPVSPEALCGDKTELLGPLREQIAALESMERLLGSSFVINRASSTISFADPSPLRQETLEYRPPPSTGTLPDNRTSPFIRQQVHLAPPGYEVLSELGRGGMGVVYKALQIKAKRVVALKMILSGGHASSSDLERFRMEGESIARLQHVNIVQVFEVGEHDGKPFFALEFCEGGNLASKLAGTPLPAREAAALIEKLARGIAEAHAKGIIHRDLKPANVLLTTGGEPKITDFGLAKQLDPHAEREEYIQGTPHAPREDLTNTGAVMGTPSYMAPEQATGDSKRVGPTCDVYALGAILYECLTGRPPFQGASLLETLDQVRHQEPVPPSQLNPKVPRDLETICLKCLRKESVKRFSGAKELADDVRRYLDGKPIVARSASALERAWKWSRRNKAVVVSFASVALILSVATSVSAWLAVRALHAESTTAQQLERTRIAEAEARERGNETQAALSKSRSLKDQLDIAFTESRRRTVLNYIAYGQLCATAARLANVPDRKATDKLQADYVRLAEWVASAAEPEVRLATADFSSALASWKAGPPPQPLKRASLALARSCKLSWLKTADEEMLKTADVIRRGLYSRACVKAAALLDTSGQVRESARNEMWELYWGELAIVESPEVESAMVRIGNILQNWPVGEPPPDALAKAVAALRLACDIP